MKGGAGALDRRISIEKLEESTDEAGQPTSAWLPYLEVWAAREPLAGKETFAAQQVKADADTGYRIRNPHVTVSPKWQRIVDQGRVYDIRSVLEIGRGEGLAIQAQARAE